MIKNILYVEDGSVDLEELKENLGSETKVIVYRQGSTPPKIENVEIKTAGEERQSTIEKDFRRLLALIFRYSSNLSCPKLLSKKAVELYGEYFA